jgi:hypothetical protein
VSKKPAVGAQKAAALVTSRSRELIEKYGRVRLRSIQYASLRAFGRGRAGSRRAIGICCMLELGKNFEDHKPAVLATVFIVLLALAIVRIIMLSSQGR